jgi:signal transduction histidine kinase
VPAFAPYYLPVRAALDACTTLAMVLAFASLAVRFHRAGPVERRQILWPLVAIAGLIVPWAVGDPIWWTASLTIPLVPAAIAVAVLRYRLYGIDTLITRAIVGAGLVGVFGGVYVVASAASTIVLADLDQAAGLAAALCAGALYVPARRLLQRGADRLLYGTRGDPVALAERITGGLQQADPGHALLAAVDVLREGLAVTGAAVEVGDERTTSGDLVTVVRTVPLVWHGEPVGQLLIGPPGRRRFAPAHDERVIAALTPYVADAAHAVRVLRDLRRSRERILTAREEERRRLRRDLHDGLGQSLTGMAMTITAARLSLRESPEAADRVLVRLRAGMDSVTSDIRTMVYGLRPPALDELGLGGALRELAGSTCGAAGGPVEVEIEGEAEGGLPAAVEVAVYRIAQEALNNAGKHAAAEHITLRATWGSSALRLRVEDDGGGLAPDARAGVGLASMRERAAELGGLCSIGPRRDGRGTSVEAVFTW